MKNTTRICLVFGNLGSGFEKQVPRFYFQKPGYPGRVLGFQNVPNWRFLAEKIAKLALFGQKIAKFLQKSPNWPFLVHQNGNYKFFSELCLKLYQFLKKISILLQNVVFWTPFNMLLRYQSTVVAVFDAALQLGPLCFCSRTKYMIPDNNSRSYLVAALLLQPQVLGTIYHVPVSGHAFEQSHDISICLITQVI